MLQRRFHFPGLLAVLLALMAQLGAGASVPRIDPVTGAAALCHSEHGAGGTPSHPPIRSDDCLICPLCVALHVPSAILVPVRPAPMPATGAIVVKTDRTPPATAPPTLRRPPNQPRAPPTFS